MVREASIRPTSRPRLSGFALILLLLILFAPGTGRAQDATVFYPARFYPDSPDAAGASVISLQPGDTSLPLIITCRPSGGSVAVRILSEVDGAPVVGLLVEASVGRHRSSARTGADGRVLIPGVPHGFARIRTRSDDPRSVTGAYAVRYAPGVIDSAAAQRYKVFDGATTDAGDMVIPPAGRIKAVVEKPGGHPWPAIPVVLKSADGACRTSCVTDENGRITFGGLEPGSYRLWADARGTEGITESWDGSRDTTTATPIHISGADLVSGIVISPDQGGAILGDVRHRDTNFGLPDVEVRAYPPGAAEQYYATRTEALGFYSLRGLPAGSYIVHVPAIRRYYPDAEAEADARTIAVTEGSSTQGIDLRGKLDADCLLPPNLEGVIEGGLQADFGRMPSARIVASGQAGTLSMTLTAGGVWRLRCLPAGSYIVGFIPEGVYRTQYHQRANDPESARSVEVVAGDTTRHVDFYPDLGAVLRGSVLSQGGLGLERIPIVAAELSIPLTVTGETDEGGNFTLDHLPDGTGLPAGDWIVATDSVAIQNTAVTAVLRVDLMVEVSEAGTRFHFSYPPGANVIDWRLECRTGGAQPQTLIDAGGHPLGVEAVEHFDPIDRPGARYRLTVFLRIDGFAGEYRTDWVTPSRIPSTSRHLFPQPWDGKGEVTLPGGVAPGGAADLFGPDGAHRLRLIPREGRIVLEGHAGIASGVYFVRWKDAAGRMRAQRIVLQR